MIDGRNAVMKRAILSLRRPRQQGVTLIEALVALLVMSFGMVALVALLGNLRRSTDVGKQRSEAMRLAQAEVAKLRAFSLVEKANPLDTTVSDYENDIVTPPAPVTLTVADSNTAFTIGRSVTDLTSGNQAWAKTVKVEVSWRDRGSSATDPLQTITLNSIISRTDPAFAGAVGITPAPGGNRQPQERHPAIPPGASDLGNKTSAFRPSGLASVVWVFNNVSGAITKLCTIAPATALTASTVAAAGCSDTLGYLLSGTINFSNTNPANPSVPEATAVELDLTVVGGTYYIPRLDSSGAQMKDSSGNVLTDPVTVAAPSSQCFDDAPSVTPSAQAFVNYSCIVFPNAATATVAANWSGSLQLTGLSIGTLASEYRVCRYSADYNGNGGPYLNAQLDWDNYEHPAVYAKVTGSLPRQNFLVVKGDVSCPTAPAVNLSTGVFVNHSTVQLQP
jgi:Tfp pilus assembly protein PilV